MIRSSLIRCLAGGAIAVSLIGCGSQVRPFPAADPRWVDQDLHPFKPVPEKAFSPLYWDALDRSLFQPLSEACALTKSGRAINVNAIDEVPDSSWFQNRIGAGGMSVEAVAHGACGSSRLNVNGPWTVISGKPDGANPGFTIRANDGNKYLLKFDGQLQPERASAGDVIGSRVYYAAGFSTPCNQVVWFSPSILTIAPTAMAEAADGKRHHMTAKDLDRIFVQAARGKSGVLRAGASRLFDEKPLGPWTYDGLRSDDPNDVVPHEDRRELRGSYVLAAWLDHVDARDQNTLSLWHRLSGSQGYVSHAFIDWGDCLGLFWDIRLTQMVRRGHSYLFDLPQIAADYITFGAVRRVWEGARLGPAGLPLGFFDIARFQADNWKPSYPNPAFSRRDEADCAWMARVIAHFSDEMLEAIVHEARLSNPLMQRELLATLRGRRDKLTSRFFARTSPLAWPSIELAGAAAERLCVSDLAVRANTVLQASRGYSAELTASDGLRSAKLDVQRPAADRICVDLPSAGPARPTVEFSVIGGEAQRLKALIHLYRARHGNYRVAGLERLEL
jgi:hypothetical protein